MTEIIDLNSKRPPVVYRVTIVHHYDDTLEFMVEDVADDPRSREAVMSAFQRISGADEEIEKLRTDVRHAVFADCEYAAEMDRQNAALREENARLREALIDTLASLVASVDLLECGGKKAAPSDKMFEQMLVDYKNTIERGRYAAAIREKRSFATEGGKDE